MCGRPGPTPSSSFVFGIANGLGAGPLTTAAAAWTSNSEPWQGQTKRRDALFQPFTSQPVWVQAAE